MTVGSGLSIGLQERDQFKQNMVLRQLIEGRSNAVGTATLTSDGVATRTVVTAPVCGPNSAVFLFPQTAHAAAKSLATHVAAADVTASQFTITHGVTSFSDCTYWWVCLG